MAAGHVRHDGRVRRVRRAAPARRVRGAGWHDPLNGRWSPDRFGARLALLYQWCARRRVSVTDEAALVVVRLRRGPAVFRRITDFRHLQALHGDVLGPVRDMSCLGPGMFADLHAPSDELHRSVWRLSVELDGHPGSPEDALPGAQAWVEPLPPTLPAAHALVATLRRP